MKTIKIISCLIIVLGSCQSPEDKGIGESGLGNDAIDYNLKEYNDSIMNEDSTVTIGYDQPPTKMTPRTAINDNVKYIMEKEPLLNRYNIEIDVFRDTIYLEGEVYSFQDKQRIEKLLSDIEGVAKIENEIIIKNMISSPYQHPYQYYAYPTITAPELEPDEKIKEKVEHELSWSPFVNEDEIEVIVRNGNVILKGTVDTRTEKKYAELNAIEGGAFTVENHLIVEYQ